MNEDKMIDDIEELEEKLEEESSGEALDASPEETEEPVEPATSETDNEAPELTEAKLEVLEEKPIALPPKDRFDALLEHEKAVNEYKEFSELFPGVELGSLPDSVTADVRAGVPLSAAYALYRYRREAAEAKAALVNEKNKEKSFAVKANDTSDSYFSPAEVREMSAAEVKANYSKILDSMSHWH